MAKPPTKKPGRWPVFMILGLILGLLLAFGAMQVLPTLPLLTSDTDSRNTQVINSITREEQVVLVGLGIEGISQKNKKGEVFGIEIPGSNRALFLRYSFTAKLGLEGKDVTVTQAVENEFVVSIPRFIFIGHDNPSFAVAAQTDGALSWTVPEIDPVDMINEILNDEAKDKYLAANEDLLRDQAKRFYTNIINSIDPEALVRFEFHPAGTP